MLNANDCRRHTVRYNMQACISRGQHVVLSLSRKALLLLTAAIFITLMVGNLKSCSSSGPWWNNAHAKFHENTLYAYFSIWTNIFLCTLPLNRANTRNVDPFQCKAAQKLQGTEIKAKRILVSYMIKVLISCYFSFQLLPPVAQLWKMATQVNTGKCAIWYHHQNRQLQCKRDFVRSLVGYREWKFWPLTSGINELNICGSVHHA